MYSWSISGRCAASALSPFRADRAFNSRLWEELRSFWLTCSWHHEPVFDPPNASARAQEFVLNMVQRSLSPCLISSLALGLRGLSDKRHLE